MYEAGLSLFRLDTPSNSDESRRWQQSQPQHAEDQFTLKDVEFTEWRRLNLTAHAIKLVVFSPGYILVALVSKIISAAKETLFPEKKERIESTFDLLEALKNASLLGEELTLPGYKPTLAETRCAEEIMSYYYAVLECIGISYENQKKIETDLYPAIFAEIDKLKDSISQQKPIDGILKNIKDHFRNFAKNTFHVSQKDFEDAYDATRPDIIAEKVNNSITLQKTDKEQTTEVKLTERTSQLSTYYGGDYLRQRTEDRPPDENYKAPIEHLQNHSYRVSTQGGPQFQGTILNGQIHGVCNEEGKCIGVVLRSGAFTVHDRKSKTMGLSALELKLEQLKQLQIEIDYSDRSEVENIKKKEQTLQQELDKLGFDTIEEFEEELTFRRDMCIAQALPKLVQSIGEMAQNEQSLRAALQTGSFLHVEEGLLSHLDSSERVMIEDMKGTLDYLRQNCKIVLDNEVIGPVLEITESNSKPFITIRCPFNAEVEPAYDSLMLTSLYFNTGINEWQTFGHLFKGYDPLQAQINTESLNELHRYASQLTGSRPEVATSLNNLTEHYGKKTNRSAKDMRGLELRTDVVKAVGGGQGIVCKSGKDRTGAAVSKLLAEDIAASTGVSAAEARKKLFGGLSYRITGVNTGKGNAYAFNWLQRLFLPRLWCPPANLCGSRAS